MSITLSKKRQKELDRLRKQADSLWQEQQEVLAAATSIAREAGRQAGNFSREELQPRVRDAYNSSVRPVVDGASATARTVSTAVRSKAAEVIPAITASVGSTLAAIDAFRDREVRAALKGASALGLRRVPEVTIVAPKKAPVGRYILIGIGVVAVAAVAYAAWQTLRADDDLWVEDDEADDAVETV